MYGVNISIVNQYFYVIKTKRGQINLHNSA